MSWLDRFPYTNFHELNLDWFLRTFVKLVEDWTQFKTETGARFDTIEEEIEALRTYVNDYFDNLDVQEEINNKLDQMLEDGSLAAILESLRGVDGQTIAFQNVCIENYQKTDTQFLQVQGMCINEAAKTYLYATVPPREAGWGSTTVRLTKRSIDNFEYLQSVDLTLGHANGMTYNKDTGKIYVAYGPYYNSSGDIVQSNIMCVVDYATLTLEGTVQITNNEDPFTFVDISYDPITGYTWVYNEAVIARIDVETGIVDLVVPMALPVPTPPVGVNCKVRKGLVYTLYHSPNMLTVAALYEDSATMIMLKEYTIPYWCGDYMFVGETESIDFYNDDVYFSSFSWETTRYDHSQIMLYRCNPTTNTVNGLYADWWSVTSSVTHTVYVDSNSNNLIENGTESAPFKTLQTAVNAMRNGNPYKFMIFKVKGNHDYTAINNVDAYIQLEAWDTSAPPTIKGLYMYASRGIELNTIYFGASTGIDFVPVRLYNISTACHMINCKIYAPATVEHCLVLRYAELYVETSQAYGAQYAAYITRSRLHGILTYSENPSHRVQGGIYSAWYTNNSNYGMNRPTQEFATTEASASMFPSAKQLAHYDSDAPTSGTITYNDTINNVNFLVIVTTKSGTRATNIIPKVNGTYYLQHGSEAPLTVTHSANGLQINTNTGAVGIKSIFGVLI